MLSDAERVDAQITMRMAREGRLHIFPTEVLEIINAFNKPAEKEIESQEFMKECCGIGVAEKEEFDSMAEFQKHFTVEYRPLGLPSYKNIDAWKIIPKIEKEK